MEAERYSNWITDFDTLGQIFSDKLGQFKSDIYRSKSDKIELNLTFAKNDDNMCQIVKWQAAIERIYSWFYYRIHFLSQIATKQHI